MGAWRRPFIRFASAASEVLPVAMAAACVPISTKDANMSNAPQIAEVAALVGDPARANILCALLGGRALTATELAYAAGVTPQTASGHLGKLAAARLIVP